MLMWTRAALVSCVLTLFITICLYKTKHTPPVGVYIAIMGLVAACVTFRKEPRRSEKFCWILVMTVLMVAEINNLYIAEADQLLKFQQTSGALDDTKSGLEATKNGLERTSSGLSSTAADLKDLIGKTTGGASYLWYEPTVMAIGENALEGYKNTVIVNAFPRVFGHYSLPFAHVEVVGPEGWVFGGASPNPSLEYQAIGPNELLRSRQGMSVKYPQAKHTNDTIHVLINTSNGSYEELIRVEKIGEKWVFGARLYKVGKKAPLRTVTSSGFPKGGW
jgi:hypothetical protein